jgi:cystine transport system permease protein
MVRASVVGLHQAIKLLNQGRVDVVINDSIAVYAYLAETGDEPVVAHHGERASSASPPARTVGCCPT